MISWVHRDFTWIFPAFYTDPFLMHVLVLIQFDFIIKSTKKLWYGTIISWIKIYRLLVEFWTVKIYEVSGHNICSVEKITKIKNWFQQSEK